LIIDCCCVVAGSVCFAPRCLRFWFCLFGALRFWFCFSP
jgi:hypothetical protein